jgi:hypothetical protein
MKQIENSYDHCIHIISIIINTKEDILIFWKETNPTRMDTNKTLKQQVQP